MGNTMVVDANPLLSALLGGTARTILFSGNFHFVASQHTLFEVEKYLPRVASKLNETALSLFREFQLLPVVAVQPREYDDAMKQATDLIGHRDPKDVHVLALALQLDLPIWSEDRDFEGLPGVTVYKTSDVLALIGA